MVYQTCPIMADFEITSPEGKKYVVTAPEGATQEQVLEYAKSQFQKSEPVVAQNPVQKGPDIPAVAAVNEAIPALASGSIAAPLSGLAGIAGTLLPGPEGQGAKWTKAVGDALTYQPRTEVGRETVNLISKPFELLHRLGQGAGQFSQDKLGFEPAGATAVQTAVESVPALALGARSQSAQVPSLRDTAVKNAREAGFQLTPADAGAGPIAKNLATFSSEAKLARSISMNNRQTASKLIAEDFGLPPETQITRSTLDDIRESVGNAAYEPVKNSGQVSLDNKLKLDVRKAAADAIKTSEEFSHRTENPLLKTVRSILEKDSADAGSIVAEVKLLREDAKKAFAAKDASAGRSYLSVAEALDDALDRHLQATSEYAHGVPRDLQVLREARATIAKTYAADKAINPVTGEFNPQAYAHMLRQKVPLTGGAKKVAEAATAFPRSLQNPNGLPPSGVGLWDLAFGKMAGPGLGWDIALAGTRPALRKIMQTGFAQDAMAGNSPALTPSLAAMLAASQREK